MRPNITERITRLASSRSENPKGANTRISKKAMKPGKRILPTLRIKGWGL
jgi:hypothetical protein